MSDNMTDVLLVGAGYMSKEYARVLNGLGRSFQVVGRGEDSAKVFEQETGHAVIRGGIEKYLEENTSNLPSVCIIAVWAEQHAEVCKMLMEHGAKRILMEKPGSFCRSDMKELRSMSEARGVEVRIAYNRRFYASVRAARKGIVEDGGVTSFNFEFTEWLHKVPRFEKNGECVWKLFLGNSSHVLDTAFFLGGRPEEISCFSKAFGIDPDYRTAFVGAGRTETGALFNYQANWEAPGRWSVELLTRKHRFIFRPMEKLQVQQLQSIKVEEAEVDYSLDEAYKPGVYLETKAFLEHDENYADICTLEEQIRNVEIYEKFI